MSILQMRTMDLWEAVQLVGGFHTATWAGLEAKIQLQMLHALSLLL